MFEQPTAPILDSVLLSALLAALPVVVLFVLLGVFRVRAAFAALAALAIALITAIVGWQMPALQAMSAAAEGAFYGLFPILWILVNALWIYRLSVATPWFAVLGRTIRSISGDLRVLAILIAFCFGALLESLAGFGAPVAISAAMLIAAGLTPLKAAIASLLANTAPVAFGALAAPIVALSGVAGLSTHDLSSMVGRQTPFLAVIAPLILVFIVDGRRGLRQTWPIAVVAGVVFAITQFLTSNFFAFELTDIVASVATMVAVLVMLRFWTPAEAHDDGDEAGVLPRETRPPAREVALAVMPYAVIIAIFSIAQIPAIKDAMSAVGTVVFDWPLLDVRDSAGTVVGAQTFHLDHLKATGTLLFLAGVITAIVYRLSPRAAAREYRLTLGQLRWTILTVSVVLALSFVMNLSGQTASLGFALASAGGFFALLSPLIGWLGVAITGSDTASNSLFGQLQVTAAQQTGLNPLVMASANTSAGVLGKMLSLQNLAVASAAVGLEGSEGTLLRRLVGWSLGLLVLLTILIVLQTTPVLGWMVP
jgi:lactate permease